MADDSGEGSEGVLRTPHPMRTALRTFAALAIVAAFVVAVGDQWPRVREALGHLNAALLLPALLATLGSLAGAMSAWRALLADLGSPISAGDASRIFFVGQLGKYLPGSVWPVVVQMELGRDIGLSRKRVALVSLLSLGFSVGSVGLIGLACAPVLVPHRFDPWGWLGPVLLLPTLWLLVHPGLVNRVLAAAIRLIRRDPSGVALSGAGLRQVMGWWMFSSLCLGGQAYLLLLALHAHGPHLLLRAIGAFSVAVVVGILVILAPAGAGVREGVLIVLLAPVLSTGGATALAVVSRGVLSVADLLVAGGAAWSARRRRDLRRTGQPS